MRTQIGSIAVLSAVLVGAVCASDESNGGVESGHRRDPFTFISTLPDVAPPTPVRPPPGTVQTPMIDLVAMHLKLQTIYEKAESEFLDGNAGSALAACDEGMATLQSIPADVRSNFGQQQTSFQQMLTAAQRNIAREANERAFKQLNIAVTGLVIRERQPHAIINARIVGRGDYVVTALPDQTPLITDIRRDEVIVMYRGYLMPLTVPVDDRK